MRTASQPGGEEAGRAGHAPGTTWKLSPMPLSISDVMTLTRGKVLQILLMPSGAAIRLRNRILHSCTPRSSSTCAGRPLGPRLGPDRQAGTAGAAASAGQEALPSRR